MIRKLTTIRSILLFSLMAMVSIGCGGSSGGGDDDDSIPKAEIRVLAKNVLLNYAYASATEVDTETTVLAENVIYENSEEEGDIESGNVEDALTETNVDLASIIPGTWITKNLGKLQNGQVIFYEDGTYEIDSGYFEAGGSFWNNTTSGNYLIHDDIIAFTYAGWDTDSGPVSRFGLVIYKRPNKMTIVVQGHTHGIELLEKVED